MLIFLNSMIMMMSIIFSFLNHPLSFGLILLPQSILISSITGFMNFNFWFSYILFFNYSWSNISTIYLYNKNCIKWKI